MHTLHRIIALFVVFVLAAGGLWAQTPSSSATVTATKPDSAAVKTQPIPYPLDYCIVTGEKLGRGDKSVSRVYDGRELRFCCNQCVKDFEKNKEKYLKKLDNAIMAKEKADYPLETCVVSGEKLGSMGEPVDYRYQGRLVRLCCRGCIGTFEKDPEKYLKMIDAAQAARAKDATGSSPADTH
jgi:YHS domain-containing protein